MASSAALRIFGQNLESLPPLPKHHSQNAQDLVKKSTLKSWNGGFKMKRLFLGSVALVALGLGAPAAFAADMPAYAPPPPAPPAYTWSGCHIGGGGGYGSGTSQHFTTGGSVLTQRGTAFGTPLPAGANITDSFNLSGFIGFGELGCDWQWGAWVFGIAGDGNATNKEGQALSFRWCLLPAPAGPAGSRKLRSVGLLPRAAGSA